MTLPDDASVVVTVRGREYEVARTFASLPAAMAAVAALGSIPERAYGLPPSAPPLSPVAAALAELQDEDAPTAGLKAGEAHAPLNLPTTDEE